MEEYIKKHIDKLNETIEQIVSEKQEEYLLQSDQVKEYLQLFKNTTYGGKRIRAMLVILMYEMYASEFNDEIYKAAASYELFQSGILIHDDVIDESDLRRGIKTIHNVLGNDHLAKSNAICLGDYGMFLAQETLSNLNFEPKNLVEGMKVYGTTILNTVIGEILDVNLPFKNQNNKDDVYAIAYLKTAWYTIIGPMLLGAILAGTSEEKLDAIKNYGKHIGIAFQMKDDLLGMYGNQEVVGKPITSDVKEKKLTLLYTGMIQKIESNEVEEKDKEEFLKNYGNINVTDEECKEIADMFIKYNIRDELEKIIEEEKNKSLEYIDMITEKEEWRNVLIQLTNKLTDRNK